MQLANINNEVTMTSLELVQFINNQRDVGEAELQHRDFTAKVPKVLGLEVCEKFRASYVDSMNRTQSCFKFPKREACLMAMSYSYELQAKVYDRMTELEQKSPKTALELAKEQVLLLEALEEKQKQLTRAIETKAEIGSRREATAMNTASQAVKQVKALEIELDKSKDYCTVKRMEMLYHGQKFNWRMLKDMAANLQLPAIDVFDQNYGTVKAYHKDVWQETYAVSF